MESTIAEMGLGTGAHRPKDKAELLKWIFEEMERVGDVKPLLDHLAEDAVWMVTIPDGTPLSGEFRGKQAVAAYFAALPGIAEFHQERPQEYISHGDKVIILGEDSFLVKKTGETFRSEYALVTDFHAGLITRMVVIQNLCGIAEAYREH
ncbi:nuclear transport factor 2 family protein [Archangium lansingense]|uniref:Nuclear transport factor 2 family protein n=1 Tax=Archangium lansingense TaxID=2995310 RepID=A0ABT4A259_9BACT|nr:nuclear transport factor 2 family protein [Archangium lansinium]MCY1075067.1 nuclear transport factor 2 family protein [Archangium lansinium]